jgi:hypothetical protein
MPQFDPIQPPGGVALKQFPDMRTPFLIAPMRLPIADSCETPTGCRDWPHFGRRSAALGRVSAAECRVSAALWPQCVACTRVFDSAKAVLMPHMGHFSWHRPEFRLEHNWEHNILTSAEMQTKYLDILRKMKCGLGRGEGRVSEEEQTN